MGKRLTKEEIERVLLNNYPNSKILSINRVKEKTRKRIIVKYICGVCGTECLSAYDNIKTQKGCKTCGIIKQSKSSTKYSVDMVEKELVLRGFEWLNKSEYADANSIIKTKCMKCGRISSSNVTSRIGNNRGCLQCLGMTRKSISEVRNEINSLDAEYVVLSDEYLNAHTLMKVRHLRCNSVFSTTRANFRKGKRCPHCIVYKGEEKIKDILKSMGLNFKQQYSFKDCKFKGVLKFDFVVFINNSPILIEYNGKQHYEPVEHFGGEETFRNQIKRDEIKRKYCSENSIKLIEISYKEFDNIETILKRGLR